MMSVATADHQPQSAQGQQPYRHYLPMIFIPPEPLPSTSYYITTHNYAYLYTLGCEQGTRAKNLPGAQDSVSVLTFGYPRCFSDGRFGANFYGAGAGDLDHVSTAIKHFAAGFYECSGTDIYSNLAIGVGTTNYQGPTDACNTPQKASKHGAAWSGMVREINQWLFDQGMFHQVQAFGANDIELAWNTPQWSRAWVDGYGQVSESFFFHFGDAAGCPYEDRPNWSCQGAWTVDDVWYVSFGAPSALPLPLIYLTNGVHAKQWAYLSRYSVLQHGYPMRFSGVFTQWQACQQVSGCAFIDNTPDQAYQQMLHELAKSPATVQYLRWKTDIRWIMQSEITTGQLDRPVSTDSTLHPLEISSDVFRAALQESGLSDELETSLASKLNAFQRMADLATLSRLSAASKDVRISIPATRSAPLPFETGILPNGEIPGRPYGVIITTIWQFQTPEGHLQVGAGSAPGDEQQGALYVVFSPFGHAAFEIETILAPQGCGPLTIYDEDNHNLYLSSPEGCQLMYDLSQGTLIHTSE